jgi:flagellar basal body P-ring protein FlgI
MRRFQSTRGAACAALALSAAVALLGADDAKKKKKPEAPPPKVEETVGTIAKVLSGEYKVEGVGLVVGLENTGSNPPPSTQRTRLINEMRKASVPHPEEILERPTVSMVVVRATLMNGITTKDILDIDVELPPGSSTTSLEGGQLLMTELAPVMMTEKNGALEGKVLAVAGGPVITGSAKDAKDKKVGRVLGGGRVKKDIPYNLVLNEERRSVRTARLVENVVKQRFHQRDGVEEKGMAQATVSDSTLILKVPRVYHHNQSRYFQVIEHLSLVDSPTLRAKRMQDWGAELLDPKKAGKAALKLEGLGTNAKPTLLEGLASTNAQVRFFAAEALAYLGDVAGAEALSRTAIDRPEFRSYALKALAAMDQAAGALKLRALMGRPEVELRYGAFDALRSFDETDPFLGAVPLLADDPKPQEDDVLALQIDDGRRPRRPPPPREDPFKLYIVDSEGPPLVHISRTRKAEVVIFGRGQKLLPPIVLGEGGALLLNAAYGDDRVQISRILPGQPDNRVISSLDIGEVIRQTARTGANYPEVLAILAAASTQKNLPGPLVVDAVPLPSKAYTEIQLVGEVSKKDDAVQKAKAEAPAKPKRTSLLRSLFDRDR